MAVGCSGKEINLLVREVSLQLRHWQSQNLVFLIREWVVQQQPGINMGAGFDAQVAGGARPAREQRGRGAGNDDDHINQNVPDEPNTDHIGRELNEAVVDPHVHRQMARPRRRVRFPQPERPAELVETAEQGSAEIRAVLDNSHARNIFGQERAEGAVFRFQSGFDANQGALHQGVLELPTRDALSRATDIQRNLEEDNPSVVDGWPGIDKFKLLWLRAEQDPEEVLRIIREEGSEYEMRWVVDQMKKLQESSSKIPPKSRSALLRPKLNTDKDDGAERSDESCNGSSWVDV